ncbi:type VI secretion system ATPase TssH [Bermanella marisrubri]|uniref:ATPase with chaperone activity, ATP-binding subunit n=1 Tax=Bermanella marisrubri TaxID=207949 RepID=Q1N528_9GAMM|nr:type VI secretion system ATPase TssH [Bermanella marisrubri]EAT13250.1 ATPase with chaperone activity, ATP-binding subunit [Oceanobacter sp. RED65] [Bermanella marisrubri]QIZ84018.1 type VI secretion system ATPase TssH [Bermanella marisrubri]
MFNIAMDKLIEKLTPTLKMSLEEAAQLAMTHGNFNVEIEHWFISMLNHPHTDFLELIKKCQVIELDNLREDLAASLQYFESGNTRAPAFSRHLMECLNEAWLLASVDQDKEQITSAHIFIAAMKNSGIAHQIRSIVPSLDGVNVADLEALSHTIIGKTSESAIESPQSSESTQSKQGNTQANYLSKYAVDLTAKAEAGEIDPVIGRDDEVRQLVDVLLRRRQNNPILTGEPGVGKTAVVEGLANRIVANDVPQPLQGIRLLSLDMASLQAGASVKGEFEKRLKAVIEEVKTATVPIIVFIDEAHTIIGAGGAEGTGDAANLLKPALARGEFRTIAATTWSEYKKYFEKDPALTRRFQVVKVEEPSIESAIDMMRSLASTLEQHHNVTILDEAIEASVKLAARYIPARQLPDKSVSLLDTACARVALSQGATPSAIEIEQRRIEQSQTNLRLLQKESHINSQLDEKIEFYEKQIREAESELVALEDQLEKEQAIIGQIKEAREKGESQDELADQLKAIQGESPLVFLDVDKQAVAAIIESWTGIPVGNMMQDEINGLLSLEDELKKRVVGQDHAMQKIAQAVRISRSGLTDPRKPVGVFMMAGTSGTGKTETALALAEHLYGGEDNLITINMSEFKEEHKVSMLLGASAGYVGYGQGGVLTEAVRKKPYSVVLLDEMEKAHPGIQDVFYNLFDKGTIKDGEGNDIDFKNTLIIMTTNAATHGISKYFGETDINEEALLEDIRPELLEDFRPAFLGRCTIVPYFPLSEDVLQKIIEINFNKIKKRLNEQYNASLKYDASILEHLLSKCKDPDTGARNVENVINKSILPAISNACLEALAKGQSIESIDLKIESESFIATVA